MKVELSNGSKVYVDFYVQQRERSNPITLCEITDARWADASETPIANGKSERLLLGSGIAFCCKRDKYNKVIGKAKALHRALQRCSMTSGEAKRPLRMEIWKVFEKVFSTCPDMEHMR